MPDPVNSGPPEPAAIVPAAVPPTATTPVTARWPRWAVPVALVVLAVAIAGVFVDERQRQRELRVDVARRFQSVEDSARQGQTAFAQSQEALRSAESKIALLEGRIAESQSQQAALEALYRDLAPSRDEWALTEIEQVLLLASQQLQFAGNVQSALAALQLADSKLQRLDRPQFTPLRRALARDMDRLKQVPFVDLPGISLRLDQAIAAVDSLPLGGNQRLVAEPVAPVQDPSWWRRFLKDVWADLRQMVRLENMNEPALPLLMPAQQWYVRENVKLRLLSARLSLVLRDQVGLHADLKAADDWLRQYFDPKAKSVQAVQTLIKQLQAMPVTGETPDLVGSLEAVRVLRLARDRNTPTMR